jgi:hypothetical protein
MTTPSSAFVHIRLASATVSRPIDGASLKRVIPRTVASNEISVGDWATNDNRSHAA